MKILTAATTLIIGVATAPVLYAHSSKDTTGVTTAQKGHGNMMGQGNMGHGNMMGQGNMMGMMGQMMKTHTRLMESMIDNHAVQKSDEQE